MIKDEKGHAHPHIIGPDSPALIEEEEFIFENEHGQGNVIHPPAPSLATVTRPMPTVLQSHPPKFDTDTSNGNSGLSSLRIIMGSNVSSHSIPQSLESNQIMPPDVWPMPTIPEHFREEKSLQQSHVERITPFKAAKLSKPILNTGRSSISTNSIYSAYTGMETVEEYPVPPNGRRAILSSLERLKADMGKDLDVEVLQAGRSASPGSGRKTLLSISTLVTVVDRTGGKTSRGIII